ncbi:FliG C-terminal domain-containing protein [Photobacterium toruni]|uniref:FliG C-terminal domain-containing protein n=1 Tax=Photobacterium toruni TaxID=1935446 RepID=UPI002110A585|nr:FliG C-terminal domain-containing protein [Photobacterium toruni]
MTKKKLERRRLNGDDKVRILMKLIPMEDFEQVLDKLERKQAEKLLILMKDDDQGVPEKITKVEAVEVLTEFNEYMSRLVNPDDVAMTDAMQALIQQKLIEFNLVEEQRLYGFDKLAELSVDQIINIIFKESQQISAVILSRLDSDKTVEVIQKMSNKHRTEILLYMGTSQNISREKLKEINDWLEDKIDESVNKGTYDGAKEVAQILEGLTEDEMLEQLELIGKTHPDLVNEIRGHILTFNDILMLDDMTLYIILNEIDASTIGLAIRNLPPEKQEKALSSLSENARQIAELELTGGNVLDVDILAAQNNILATARDQEVNGLVQLR